MGKQQLYDCYIKTKGKKAIEKFKDVQAKKLHTLDEAQTFDGYAGRLESDTVLIDIDDAEESEKMMNIVEDYQLDCRVLQTSRGRHFLFKNNGLITRNRTHAPLAIGLTADIKIGKRSSYEVLKVDGEERFIEWDIEEGGSYQEVPKYFIPVRSSADFIGMESGDGRNQALFNYILTLQSNDMNIDEIRETIKIINQYVLSEPLGEDELETILRDEAFQKPVFFNGSTFLFDKFGNYLMNNHHIIRLNGQLHIYKDGIYTNDMNAVSNVMRSLIPNIKKSQKSEVIDYLYDMTPSKTISDARFIAFNNGIYDLIDETLNPFSPEIIVTNKVPWDYRDDAYDETMDAALNAWACYDESIRALLEECIGYCMYRDNKFNKAFILTGEKANGKSTFLNVLIALLGEKNISALDLKELGERFNTASLFGKLANIGDDISDDFIADPSLFKKITGGGRIKGERKGLDPFEFNPYAKMIFSANDIPRIKDKTGAVLRRLEIIPFNAVFGDADADPDMKRNLVQQSSMESLIQIGLCGLKRLLASNQFTRSAKVDAERNAYSLANNSVLGFIAEFGEKNIINEWTKSVYTAYQEYCNECGNQPYRQAEFSRQINQTLGTHIGSGHKAIRGKRTTVNCFVK